MKRQTVIAKRIIPEPGDENLRVWLHDKQQFGMVVSVDAKYVEVRLSNLKRERLPLSVIASADTRQSASWLYEDLPFIKEV